MHEYEAHDESSPLFVDENHRICITCKDESNVKELAFFKISTPGSGIYSTSCRACRLERAKANQDHDHKKAITTLTDTLARATRTNFAGKPFSEVVSSIMKPMGGEDTGNRTIGRVFHRAMRRGLRTEADKDDLALAVKAGSVLINAAATVEKNRGPSIDPSELSADEARQLLMEPARMMILDDAEFRRELLSDSKVRKLLLRELGVQTIDVTELEEEFA